jgi:hypothetical protein
MNQKEYVIGYYDNEANFKEIVSHNIESIDKLTEEYTRDEFIAFLELDASTIGSKFVITDGKESYPVFFKEETKIYKEMLKTIIKEEMKFALPGRKFEESFQEKTYIIIDKINNMGLRKLIKEYNGLLSKKANSKEYEKLKI